MSSRISVVGDEQRPVIEASRNFIQVFQLSLVQYVQINNKPTLKISSDLSHPSVSPKTNLSKTSNKRILIISVTSIWKQESLFLVNSANSEETYLLHNLYSSFHPWQVI